MDLCILPTEELEVSDDIPFLNESKLIPSESALSATLLNQYEVQMADRLLPQVSHKSERAVYIWGSPVMFGNQMFKLVDAIMFSLIALALKITILYFISKENTFTSVTYNAIYVCLCKKCHIVLNRLYSIIFQFSLKMLNILYALACLKIVLCFKTL